MESRKAEQSIQDDIHFKSFFAKDITVNKEQAMGTIIYDPTKGPRVLIEAVSTQNSKFVNMYSAKLLKDKFLIDSEEIDDIEDEIVAGSRYKSFTLNLHQLDELIETIDEAIKKSIESDSSSSEDEMSRVNDALKTVSMLGNNVSSLFNDNPRAEKKALHAKIKEHNKVYLGILELLKGIVDVRFPAGLEAFKRSTDKYEPPVRENRYGF